MQLLGRIKANAKKAGNEIQRNIVSEFMNFSNAEKVSGEVFDARISACEGCEKFDKETRRCTICTCFMDVKASLAKMPVLGSEIKCSDNDNPKW